MKRRPTRSASKPRRTSRRHHRRILRLSRDTPPPIPGDSAALFLNIDETVSALVARPERAQAPPSLLRLIFALRRELDGAVAIMSGRRLADIDWLLWPAVLPGAGAYGAELRRDFAALGVRPAEAAGNAVEELMRTAPFAGRMPIYVGDGDADESGFAIVRRLGGIGVRVGGPSRQGGIFRLQSLDDIPAWLAAARRH